MWGAPLVAIEFGDQVKDGALLAVALGFAAQLHLWRRSVRLAHPVATVVLLLLGQVASAVVHLRQGFARPWSQLHVAAQLTEQSWARSQLAMPGRRSQLLDHSKLMRRRLVPCNSTWQM